MSDLSFVTLDVFTTTRFEGNPLAIVRVPANVTLSQQTKQTVAREFNFSETVFLHEGTQKDQTAEHVVDIFTPSAELPFAGHPTIGSATYVLGSEGAGEKATIVVKAGRIPIERVVGGVRASVPHDVHLHAGHLRTVASVDAIRRSGALGGGVGHPVIEAAELDAPVFSIVRGMAFILVKLPSLELLGTVSSTGPALVLSRVDDLQDAGPWANNNCGRYYYVVQDDDKKKGTTMLRTRMITSRIEDPATGSAACALASYLALQQKTDAKGRHRYEITQGVEMGRRSEIVVEVDAKKAADGAGAIEAVYLGGTAVEVTRGTIRV